MPAAVLIAGGGVGGLEAALALQTLAEDRVEVTLLAPERHFTYRPLAVAEPFGGPRVLRFPLGVFAEDRGLRFIRDAVAAVEPDARIVRTQDGATLPYDVLLLAIGARALESVPGALIFRGARDAERIRELVDDIREGGVEDVAFVVPPGVRWSLPLYELALAAAVVVRDAGTAVRLKVVTPERAPLELFGREASDEVARLLADHDVALLCDRFAGESADGRLWMPMQGSLAADRVVALPRLVGRRIAGVPRDELGFAPVDAFGRVLGLERVYAVGDGTDRPLKQGGLAAQQADVAAAAIAASLGADIDPVPYEPVLRGVLLTGDGVRYLRSVGGDHEGEVSDRAPWWPGAKIAGRHLAPYLATHLADAEAPTFP